MSGRILRSAGRVGLSALALLIAAPLAAQLPNPVVINPVLERPQGVADPFILKYNGEYYLYATGNPIQIYHSTDLVEWDAVGPAVGSSDAAGAWNQADVWAPEVEYRNGKFYLYYSATKADPDWRIGEMARRVGVAVSDSPRGPFVDSGSPVTPGWAIDGHIFRDPDGGDEYLFYSYLYEPRLPGAGIVVDRLLTPTRVAGKPAHVTRGTEAWEDKDADPTNGSLRYTNEGPTVVKRGDRYYLLYSGGSWDLPTYAMGYAVSDRVMPEGGLDGPGWRKPGPPILRGTPLVQGPGHNTVTKAPNNVDDITAYHARAVPFNSPGDRQTFIDRLYWFHDRPYLDEPTVGARPAPDRPLFRDLFDRTDGRLESGWTVRDGSWRLTGGELHGGGLALVEAQPLSHYRFEANVRGIGGVAAYYRGENDRLDVWLDPARSALVSGGVIAGRRVAEEATPLDPAFRFDSYHQLLVTRNGPRLRVDLDGVHAQEREVGSAPAQAGLLTRRGSADFDGVALTAYFEDSFSRPDSTWAASGGAWMVDEGSFHQVAGGEGRYIAVKGDPAESYEFTASVKLRDAESSGSRVGLVAAANGAGDLVLAGFDHTIWPFARFSIFHVSGGRTDTIAVEMPRGFEYDAYHTIRVVKQQDRFTIYLDGVEAIAARIPIGEARPGLFTEGARAAFDDVTMKWTTVPSNLILNGSFEAPTEDSWQITRGASRNLCCGHTDTHRLLIRSADGVATQVVDGLAPGDYTLYAWARARGGAAVVNAAPAGGTPAEATAPGEDWQRITLDFSVPSGSNSATISISGRFSGQPEASVSVDDVYLFRR